MDNKLQVDGINGGLSVFICRLLKVYYGKCCKGAIKKETSFLNLGRDKTALLIETSNVYEMLTAPWYIYRFMGGLYKSVNI